jgi:hypothetical protein
LKRRIQNVIGNVYFEIRGRNVTRNTVSLLWVQNTKWNGQRTHTYRNEGMGVAGCRCTVATNVIMCLPMGSPAFQHQLAASACYCTEDLYVTKQLKPLLNVRRGWLQLATAQMCKYLKAAARWV